MTDCAVRRSAHTRRKYILSRMDEFYMEDELETKQAAAERRR